LKDIFPKLHQVLLCHNNYGILSFEITDPLIIYELIFQNFAVQARTISILEGELEEGFISYKSRRKPNKPQIETSLFITFTCKIHFVIHFYIFTYFINGFKSELKPSLKPEIRKFKILLKGFSKAALIYKLLGLKSLIGMQGFTIYAN
jgi:hypothetical protein